MHSSASVPSIDGKGKKAKRFLDQSASLQLATSIVEAREEKSQMSSQKRFQHNQTQAQGPRETRKSLNKSKLKEIKAKIAADKAQKKKSKAAARKKSSVEFSAEDPPSRRRVSFA